MAKSKVTPARIIIIGILVVLLSVAIRIGVLVLIVLMFVWNITDIMNVGPNFWNIFWLCLAVPLLLGWVVSGLPNKK